MINSQLFVLFYILFGNVLASASPISINRLDRRQIPERFAWLLKKKEVEVTNEDTSYSNFESDADTLDSQLASDILTYSTPENLNLNELNEQGDDRNNDSSSEYNEEFNPYTITTTAAATVDSSAPYLTNLVVFQTPVTNAGPILSYSREPPLDNVASHVAPSNAKQQGSSEDDNEATSSLQSGKIPSVTILPYPISPTQTKYEEEEDDDDEEEDDTGGTYHRPSRTSVNVVVYTSFRYATVTTSREYIFTTAEPDYTDTANGVESASSQYDSKSETYKQTAASVWHATSGEINDDGDDDEEEENYVTVHPIYTHAPTTLANSDNSDENDDEDEDESTYSTVHPTYKIASTAINLQSNGDDNIQYFTSIVPTATSPYVTTSTQSPHVSEPSTSHSNNDGEDDDGDDESDDEDDSDNGVAVHKGTNHQVASPVNIPIPSATNDDTIAGEDDNKSLSCDDCNSLIGQSYSHCTQFYDEYETDTSIQRIQHKNYRNCICEAKSELQVSFKQCGHCITNSSNKKEPIDSDNEDDESYKLDKVLVDLFHDSENFCVKVKTLPENQLFTYTLTEVVTLYSYRTDISYIDTKTATNSSISSPATVLVSSPSPSPVSSTPTPTFSSVETSSKSSTYTQIAVSSYAPTLQVTDTSTSISYVATTSTKSISSLSYTTSTSSSVLTSTETLVSQIFVTNHPILSSSTSLSSSESKFNIAVTTEAPSTLDASSISSSSISSSSISSSPIPSSPVPSSSALSSPVPTSSTSSLVSSYHSTISQANLTVSQSLISSTHSTNATTSYIETTVASDKIASFLSSPLTSIVSTSPPVQVAIESASSALVNTTSPTVSLSTISNSTLSSSSEILISPTTTKSIESTTVSKLMYTTSFSNSTFSRIAVSSANIAKTQPTFVGKVFQNSTQATSNGVPDTAQEIEVLSLNDTMSSDITSLTAIQRIEQTSSFTYANETFKSQTSETIVPVPLPTPTEVTLDSFIATPTEVTLDSLIATPTPSSDNFQSQLSSIVSDDIASILPVDSASEISFVSNIPTVVASPISESSLFEPSGKFEYDERIAENSFSVSDISTAPTQSPISTEAQNSIPSNSFRTQSAPSQSSDTPSITTSVTYRHSNYTKAASTTAEADGAVRLSISPIILSFTLLALLF